MKISCGLFGLAEDMQQDFWGTMKALKEMGFDAIEPLTAYPGDPALAMMDQLPPFLKVLVWPAEKIADMRPRFGEIGLALSSGHIGFGPGTDPAELTDEILKAAEMTGIRHFLTSLTFDTEEKAYRCAEQLSKANEKLNPHDVTLGYHNHEMEFQPVKEGQGKTFMDLFLAESDENVKLQLDTGWQMYAGNDVIGFIKKYKSRIQSVHLKDFVRGYEKVPREDAFAAIGNGALPVKEILEIIPELDLFDYGLMIDQDKPAKGEKLMDNLTEGAKILKALGVK